MRFMRETKKTYWYTLWRSVTLFISFLLVACGGTEEPVIVTTVEAPTVVPAIPQEGHKAPDFRLETTDGNSINLSNYLGKPIIVNFWATWCSPCRNEMPDMQQIYTDYRREGLIILGINQQEGVDTVTEFGKEYTISFPLLLDPQNEVAELYQIRNLPTSIFIDSQGYIRSIQIGSMGYDDFQREVENHLLTVDTAKPAVSTTEPVMPTAEPVVPTGLIIISGCVTAHPLNVRSGPSTSYDVITTLPYGECHQFDARDVYSNWVRLHELTDNGNRLWVSTIYIDSQDDIEDLQVR